MQFLSLPINETLLMRFKNAEAQRSQANTLNENSALQTYVPTVFQDTSNPLLSQLAIFAKSLDYLEHHESNKNHHHLNNSQVPQAINDQNMTAPPQSIQESAIPERRTTRQQKKEVLKQEGTNQDKPLQHQQANQGDIYLIPQTKAQALLPKETML